MNKSPKKVTIYDVAKKANVTIATVSRVINGKNNVALETKERVMQAIEELNYYPSPFASGLPKRRSQEIGLLVPFFFGEFFLKLLGGITKRLIDYELILYDAATPERKKNIIAKIVGENKLDGLFIVSLPILTDEEIQLKKAKFPLVLIDNQHSKYSSVLFDNNFGAYKAVEYLVEQGHRKIGIITGAAEDPFHLTVARERLKGYKMALTMSGINIEDRYIAINDWSREGAYKLAKKMLSMKNPPTAIFAISDLQAIGVMEAARELNIFVPDQLSIIGYDNMDFSDYVGLTTMSQPLNVAAQLGLDLLLEEMETGICKREKIVLQPTLVIRNSVAPPPNLSNEE